MTIWQLTTELFQDTEHNLTLNKIEAKQRPARPLFLSLFVTIILTIDDVVDVLIFTLALTLTLALALALKDRDRLREVDARGVNCLPNV